MYYYDYDYPPTEEGGGVVNMLQGLIDSVTTVVTGFVGIILDVFTQLSTVVIDNPLFALIIGFVIIGMGLGLLFRFISKARA